MGGESPPPARECADLCGIKKESVKCAFVRTKKDGVRSSFTQPRAPAYRVHKLAFGTKMHTKKGRMQTILNLHPTDVGKLLSGLVQKRMLMSIPNGRWTTYELNHDYEISPEQLKLTERQSIDKTPMEQAQETILNYLQSNQWITNVKVQELCSFTKDQAYRILTKMVNKKILRPEGIGRGRRYSRIN